MEYKQFSQWLSEHSGLRLKISRHRMVNSVEKVLSFDSEVREIYSGGADFPECKDSIRELIKRLRGY